MSDQTTGCARCGGLGAITGPIQWSANGKACWSVTVSCSCSAGQAREARESARLNAVDWNKAINFGPGETISFPIDFGDEDAK